MAKTATASYGIGVMRRIFSPANVIAVLTALITFYVGLLIDDANVAILGWAIIAAGAGALAWFVVDRRTSGASLAGVLASIPFLGAIPVDASGPAPVLSNGELADRYTGLLREIEGQTTGRVLLVSSPSPGQGASSVAVNLSIAATKAGRRVMLVDADPSPNGIGRFLSSGASPGLSDVASGSSTLAEASRMWTLDDGTRFPMLPSGSSLAAEGDLSGVLVADALDVVSEHADLIIIDVPPVMWSDATPELGAHADGTILVLTDAADPDTVADAIERLESAGAPVLGYVRNRSKGTSALAPHATRRTALRFVALALILVFGYTAYTGAQLFASWNRRETQVLDTGAVADLGASAQAAEPADPDDIVDLPAEEGTPVPSSPSVTAPTEAYETLLLIGNDEIGGAADVVLYLVRPTNGTDPFMVSLPRDLYVENPCTKGNSRINALIKGCPSKDINGPTLLSYEVGAITGIEVDHFAWFDFDSFKEIIDAVGGVEICHEYPVRDAKSQLDMPAGCTRADGEQTLAWVRSRHTQQLVNGSWSSVPGASDLLRNQHQQEVLLRLFAKLKTFRSPSELTTKAASLADSFVLDDSLSISKAVNLAWGLRGIDVEEIRRIELPVRLTRSTSGQSILILTEPFDEILTAEYGSSLPTEDAIVENAEGVG